MTNITLGSLNLKRNKYAEADDYIQQASDMLERSKCPLNHPYQVQVYRASTKLSRKVERAYKNQGKTKVIDTRARRSVRFDI